MPEKKAGGWVQIMFENWNSLGIFTHRWKLNRLNYLIQQLQVDIVGGCETQCDWSFVEDSKQFLQQIRRGTNVQGIAAHNTNEKIHRERMGGTAVAAIGRLCDLVTASGKDDTGRCRWSWIRIGQGHRHTWMVSAYLPCKPGRTSRGRTVWEQHGK
jgi:hypothetical protein